MKKLLTTLAIAALSSTAALAWEASVVKTNTVDGVEFITEWRYALSDSLQPPRTATLLWVDGAIGDVTIPNVLSADGAVWNVTRVADSALANNPGLLKVEVPNTILEIGAYAFSNCTALAEVTLNYGIRYIGERAFVNTIVREITVPDSLLDMGGNISAGTLFTSTINIGDSSHFKYSDDGVLYNRDMTKLYACPARVEGTITIPNTLTNIAVDAFFGCHRLSYLNIPATVNTIGSGAFNVAGIWPGLSAPESTPKLKTIFFNGTPPEAPDDIFNGAPEDLVIYALSNEWDGMSTWKGRSVLVLDSANPPVLSFTDETGITWFYRIVNEEVEIYNEDASGNPTTAVSPASTAGIAYKESEDSLVTRKALKIPDAINGYAVTKIGAHAFDGCKALIYVGIPASVREIGDGAFSGCASISAIGDSRLIPFGTADNTIDLPRGITNLGRRPFEGIQASTVLLPYTLDSTDGNPVAGCAYVTSLSVDSTCPAFYSEGNILYNKRKNTVVAVPANYDGASVSFLDSVTTIGDEALFGCKNVSQIQVPEALEAIGARAFAGCESIKSLALPDTLATIGDVAFSDCFALTRVTYVGNAPTAADDIYEGTPESLASYVYDTAIGFTTDNWKSRNVVVVSSGEEQKPGSDEELSQVVGNFTWYFRVVDGVAEIWRNGATAVTSTDPIMGLTLPTTLGGYIVKGIGDGALANLRGISSLSVPSTYEWIGNGALSNCTSLASVSLADDLRTIGKESFAGTLLSTLTIPAYVKSIDGNPAIGCTRFAGFAVNAANIDFAADESGLLYNADMSQLLAVPARTTDTTIPTSVTTIADDAFAGCSVLTKISFLGNAPTAAEDILADTPETLNITVLSGSTGWDGNPASDALPSSNLWRDRKISADYASSTNQEYDDGTVKWTYNIAKGKAIITGASGEAETVTVPATLGGFSVSAINADALDGLSGVKAYKSDSALYMAKNGCLYSADGKRLIRVPDLLVLPYSVTTEVSSNIVMVTIIPGIKDSGNPGNDGTSVTTNITSVSSSRTTKNVDGDIPLETLLAGVTAIADHAFYGCNNNLVNESSSVSETLSGETGFIGTSGDAYVRMSTQEITTKTTYTSNITLPSSVKTVGARAIEGSGVVLSRTSAQQTAADTAVLRQEPQENKPLQLEENSNYIGWIEQNGKTVGTVTVKTGKKRNGVIKTSGSVIKVGAKKTKIKNAAQLANIGGLTLVKNLSKSKSAADKASFNRFTGKCWTIALMAANSNAPLLDGYTTLSITAQAKGKVRITGTAADGTKISASAQMAVDGDSFKIPVAAQLYSGKRGGFAALFTVTEAGDISIDGGAIDFTAIHGDASTRATLLPIAAAQRGNALSGDIVIWGVAEDGYSLSDNLGWKPRYTKSSGQFKGSVNMINNSTGKRVRSTITGVVVNGVGYGTTVVKGIHSWKAEVR